MTSIDVLERFRVAGAEAREKESSEYAELLGELTALTTTEARRLIDSGHIPLTHSADVTDVVNRYGAAMNPDNDERTGIRTSTTLDALAEALPSYIVPVRGLSYQYCALCSGRDGVQAFFTATPLDPVIERAVLRCNPAAPVVTVLEASLGRVVMRSNDGVVTEATPTDTALWMYSLHEGHRCMLGPTASLELTLGASIKFVNMKLYHPDSSTLEMRVSSLLRCPNQPTRHLDMDMLLFDRRAGAVVGVIEHAHMRHKVKTGESAEEDYARCLEEIASKPTTQTRSAAGRFGCAAYRIIDHARLGTVVSLLEGDDSTPLDGVTGLVRALG